MKKIYLATVLTLFALCAVCRAENFAPETVSDFIKIDAPKTAQILLDVNKGSDTLRKNNVMRLMPIIYKLHKNMRSNQDFYFLTQESQSIDVHMPDTFDMYRHQNGLYSTHRITDMVKYLNDLENKKLERVISDNIIILSEMQKLLGKNNYAVDEIDKKLALTYEMYNNIENLFKKVNKYEDSYKNVYGKLINYELLAKNALLFSTSAKGKTLIQDCTKLVAHLKTYANDEENKLYNQFNNSDSTEISTGIKLGASLEQILAFYKVSKKITIGDIVQVFDTLENDKNISIYKGGFPFISNFKSTTFRLPHDFSFERVSLYGNELIFYKNKLITFDFADMPSVSQKEILEILERKYGKSQTLDMYNFENDKIFVSQYKEHRGGNYDKQGLFFADVKAIKEILEILEQRKVRKSEDELKKLDNL